MLVNPFSEKMEWQGDCCSLRKVLKIQNEKGAPMKGATRSHEGKKKSVTTSKGEYQGICPSCENLALCSFIQNSRQPVLFCEEFTNDGIPAVMKAGRTEKATGRRKAGSKKQKGLCATCENADGCVFPKDEAGIWHCEEYR
ncbi:MAG: hypothetical protein A4E62_01977 [Syntrophorhabdus sp. PtaU1.Bin002]|nr:MAG: hypothetical protein A4E58_02497 [Syntrophorhabdus sp. PtaB.Bin006]OPY68757.1 MAG: hypothetical protein A4E62_01977 [Syntrophorhabdus sp. PtaU1.Bin002]